MKQGIGFMTLLQLCFIVLKLCGVIAWPWLAVLIPFWVDLLIGLIAMIIFIIALFRK